MPLPSLTDFLSLFSSAISARLSHIDFAFASLHRDDAILSQSAMSENVKLRNKRIMRSSARRQWGGSRRETSRWGNPSVHMSWWLIENSYHGRNMKEKVYSDDANQSVPNLTSEWGEIIPKGRESHERLKAFAVDAARWLARIESSKLSGYKVNETLRLCFRKIKLIRRCGNACPFVYLLWFRQFSKIFEKKLFNWKFPDQIHRSSSMWTLVESSDSSCILLRNKPNTNIGFLKSFLFASFWLTLHFDSSALFR